MYTSRIQITQGSVNLTSVLGAVVDLDILSMPAAARFEASTLAYIMFLSLFLKSDDSNSPFVNARICQLQIPSLLIHHEVD
ncbi:hypothetical protein E4T56_gene18992 [Termitomyces sp. T112]|nr:hypothetical protein E4T56_gene18992 [Termitomyces sp. T112]